MKSVLIYLAWNPAHYLGRTVRQLFLSPFWVGNKVGRIGAWELGFSELRHLFFWSEESDKLNFPLLIRDPWYVTLRFFYGCFAYFGDMQIVCVHVCWTVNLIEVSRLWLN